MNKNNKKSEKRRSFEELSGQMRLKVETKQYATINEALKAYYASQGHTELHTYAEWLILGYRVKKGETALLLWSKPIRKKSEKHSEEEEVLEVEKNKFHGIINVFSNLQVEQIHTHNSNN